VEFGGKVKVFETTIRFMNSQGRSKKSKAKKIKST
jgi:hypothetical protein